MERLKNYSKNKYPKGLTQLILLILLSGLSQQLISQGQTTFDGVTKDLQPSYYSLDGGNGLQAVLDNRNLNQSLDYFIRVWVRTQSNYDQNIGTMNETVIDIPNSLQCAFLFNKSLACSSVRESIQIIRKNATTNITQIFINPVSIVLPLGDLKPQSWLHIAIGGSVSQNLSYIRVDYQDQILANINSTYLPLTQKTSQWFAFLGSRTTLKPGFIGDVRELFLATQYVDWKQVAVLKNQLIYWDTNQLGNYRLQGGNIYDEFRRNMTITLLNTSSANKPSWKYDNLPNDICYPQFQTAQILRIYSDNLNVPFGTVDSRMSTTISNYQYSASFWMRTLPGIQTDPSFSQSIAIFSLQGVFSLWFTDPQSLKIFIHSTKPQTNNQTLPIFIPSNQWVNLQFTLDRLTGYEVRVYDLQRRLIFRINQTTTFQTQTPTRQFEFFRNYQGYMKSIMIYQTKKTLPLNQSYGDLSTIKDDTLILYYKFGKANFIDQSLQSLALNNGSQTIKSVNFSGNLQFDNVEWMENLNYTNVSYQGTLLQTDKFYDGLACNDSYSIYNTKTQSSYIGYSMQNTGENIMQATVELWYKRDQLPTTLSYLFSLYSVSQKREYFGIFQKDGQSQITCKPFDSLNPSNPIELSTQFQSTSQQQLVGIWQHIACKFMVNYEVSLVQHNYLQPGQYLKSSLRNTAATYFIPQDNYYMIIGNTYSQKYGQANNQFKDVRFWKEYRSDMLIESYLYRQIDVSREPKLFSYFRLMSGGNNIYNFVGLQQNITADQQNIEIKPSNVLNLVCPQSSYLNAQGTQCVRNPFATQRLLVLPTFVNQSSNQSSLQFQVTSNFSDKYSQSYLDNLQYQWKLPSSLTAYSSQTTTSETLYISSSILSQLNQTFQVTQTVTNQQKSFFTDLTTNLMMNPCSVVTDSQSMNALNYVFLTTNPQDNDIVFNISENKIPSCGLWNTTNIDIQSNIQLQTYPSMLNIQAQATFNSDSNSFNIILPQSEQSKAQKNQEIYIIATVQWIVSDKNTDNPSFNSYMTSQNLVYVVKFIDQIVPTIVASPSQMLFIDQTLILDGGNSYYPSNGNNTNGIYYAWTCPPALKPVCQSQDHSQVLKINYQDFFTYINDFSQTFNFSLTVWKSSDYNRLGNFTTTIQIGWINAMIPQFSVNLVNSKNLIASKDNIFNLNLQNYDVNDPNLQISWQLSAPQQMIVSLLLSFQNLKTQAKVSQTSLQNNTQYQLQVTVANKSQPLASNTIVYNFTTGDSGPQNGSVFVNPVQGDALNTRFNVFISNWVTNSGIVKYRVFSSFNKQTTVLITPRYYYQNETFNGFLMPATEVVIEISDDSEVIQTRRLAVTVNAQDFSSIVNASIQSQSSDQLQYSLWQAAQYVVYDNLWQLTFQETLDIRIMILNYLDSQSGLFTVLNDQLSDQTVNFVSQAIRILNHVTNTSISLNDTIALTALQVFQQIQIRKLALKYNMNNAEFQNNYGNVISNLLDYAMQRQPQVQSANSLRRRLQANQQVSMDGLTYFSTNEQILEYIDQILQEKDNFAQYYCDSLSISDSSEVSIQQTISTDSYQLMVEKIPGQSRIVNRTYLRFSDNSFTQIPINMILQQEAKTYSGQSQDICVQVTMFNFNPLQGIQFDNQDFNNLSPVIQITTVDNNGLQIVDNVGFTSNSSIILNQFKYDFSLANNTFKNNQTTCLQIQRNQDSYSDQSWSWDSCQTVYNYDQKFISCRCSQLGPNYYAIGNDYNRTLILSPQDNTSTVVDQKKGFFESIMDFDSSVIAILIILILMILIMPLLAICLDRKDYELLKSEEYEISDEFLMKIAIKKRVPFEIVVYNKIRYLRYVDLDQLSFCTLFRIFTLELHPMINIFAKFDVELKRLVRYMFFSFQISIIAVICALVFGTTYREDDQDLIERDDDTDDEDKGNIFLVGMLIALLTLPLAEAFVSCFKATLVLENSNQQSQMSQASPRNKKISEAEYQRELQRQRNKKQQQNSDRNRTGEKFDNMNDMEEGAGRVQNTNSRLKHLENGKYKDDAAGGDNYQNTNLDVSKLEEPVVSIDRCIPCKLILIIFSFIFAILAMITVGLESAHTPKAHSISMTGAFFVAILFGEFIYNFVKLILITIFTPLIVQSEIQNSGNLRGGLSLVNCLLIPSEAKLIMRDMLLIFEMGLESEQDDQEENSDNQNRKTIEEENYKKNQQRQQPQFQNPQGGLRNNQQQQNQGPPGEESGISRSRSSFNESNTYSKENENNGYTGSGGRQASSNNNNQKNDNEGERDGSGRADQTNDDDEDQQHEISSIMAKKIPSKQPGRAQRYEEEDESSQSFEDRVNKDLENL